MKWLTSLLFNALIKYFFTFATAWFNRIKLIRKGRSIERANQDKIIKRAEEDAEEIRKDVDNTNITDIRKWLRKRTDN